MIVRRLGLIRTPKEKLVAVILESLRHIAPAAGYHFTEHIGGSYQLTVYWGNRSMNLMFTQEQALSTETEQGKSSIETLVQSALGKLMGPQPWKQAS